MLEKKVMVVEENKFFEKSKIKYKKTCGQHSYYFCLLDAFGFLGWMALKFFFNLVYNW